MDSAVETKWNAIQEIRRMVGEQPRERPDRRTLCAEFSALSDYAFEFDLPYYGWTFCAMEANQRGDSRAAIVSANLALLYLSTLTA
jgi:hypothetical protein